MYLEFFTGTFCATQSLGVLPFQKSGISFCLLQKRHFCMKQETPAAAAASAPTFIMSTMPDSNECEVCRIYKVEVNRNRYLSVTVKKYHSAKQRFTCVQLFMFQKETEEYTAKNYHSQVQRAERHSLRSLI